MNNLILFDGSCMLCSRFIRFLLRHDKKQLLWFSPNQSDTARAIIKAHQIRLPEYNSIIFVDGDKAYMQSDAVIKIFGKLGGVWKAAVFFRLLPRAFRDFLYGIVAKSRYSIFGQAKVCDINTDRNNPRLVA